MSITSNVGLFSGIDTGTLIQQLIQLEARPRELASQRVFELSSQQAGLLQINGQLNALSNIARGFRTSNPFNAARAVSSNESILTATASSTAQPGNFSLTVDRLVTTQSQLSRGFADRDTAAFGADAFTFEGAEARLAQDVALTDLNGGSGVRRGEITLTVDGSSTTVDLSRAGTIGEVIEAINGAGTSLQASAVGDRLVIENTGSGAFSIADATGSNTATDLGIAGSSSVSGGRDLIDGSSLYYLTEDTALSLLNDGNGVSQTTSVGSGAFDFTIDIDIDFDGSDDTINVFLGEITETVDGESVVTRAAAATVGDVIEIINQQLDDAGESDLRASLAADGSGIVLTDQSNRDFTVANRTGASSTTTATDLGIAGTSSSSGGLTTLTGSRVFGALNSTLLSTLNGGSGIGGDGAIDITARDGTTFNVDVSGASTLSEVIDLINSTTGGAVTASINDRGTGLSLVDNTASGAITGNFIVTGTGGDDTATALGIATDGAGVASSSIESSDLERQYISRTTDLSSLNFGAGVGTGEFVITDASGTSSTINVTESVDTIGDLIDLINAAEVEVTASINDTGDGIVIEQDAGSTGVNSISIEDTSGRVASRLNLVGTSTGTGPGSSIDGSFELTVSFDPTDTLDDVVEKLNESGRFVRATVINDGSGSQPFRLSLTSRNTGESGEYIIDTGSFDLGLTTVSEGQDARVFFGSNDPASALILSSSSNTLDGFVPGVTLDLQATSDEPVQLTVSRDVDSIVAEVEALVGAFNSVIESIDFQTRFDPETEARGALLGDGTLINLRQRLFSTLQGTADNVSSSFTRLSELGIRIGEGSTVEFDATRFREAFESDPAGVEELLATYQLRDPDDVADEEFGDGIRVTGGGEETREFDALGFAGIFEELARSYTDSISGILTSRLSGIESQIDLQNDRIEQLTQQLGAREQQLAAEFLAMERAIGQLQSQQSALSQISLAG